MIQRIFARLPIAAFCLRQPPSSSPSYLPAATRRHASRNNGEQCRLQARSVSCILLAACSHPKTRPVGATWSVQVTVRVRTSTSYSRLTRMSFRPKPSGSVPEEGTVSHATRKAPTSSCLPVGQGPGTGDCHRRLFASIALFFAASRLLFLCCRRCLGYRQ